MMRLFFSNNMNKLINYKIQKKVKIMTHYRNIFHQKFLNNNFNNNQNKKIIHNT